MSSYPAEGIAAKQKGLYVYCVAHAEDNHVFGPVGLDGAMVYTVANDAICAVVHDCQAEPYESQDPQVIERWVVTHQNVVLAAGNAFGTVLPMAFDIIVHGAEGAEATMALRDWLDGKCSRFTQLLDKLEGKAEYGVQVFWNREVIAASIIERNEALRQMHNEARGKSKGMAYLMQQNLAKAVRAAMEKKAEHFAQDCYTRIRRSVEAVQVDQLKRADGGRQMLLNLSCLMHSGSSDLGRVLDEIERTEGMSVRFTGPWPPYSFVGG